MIIVYLLLAIAFIFVSVTKYRLHPFLALIFAAFGYGLCAGMPLTQIVISVNRGFGDIVGFIGIVIVAGCIIGTFLEETGAAYTMAKCIIGKTGEKRVPLVMLILGAIVSIPVFADSGFVILNPLNKSLARKAKVSLAAATTALALGLVITHCLVPPTPGPVAAAAILGADLGLVILAGIAASAVSAVATYFFVTRYAVRIPLDPGDTADDIDMAEKARNAPPAIKSFIPIVVPLILIVLRSVALLPSCPLGDNTLTRLVGFAGQPVVALLIGMGFAFLLPRKYDKAKMFSTSGWVGKSLSSSAVIIMITAAGGAFGTVLRDSGVSAALGQSLSGAGTGIWLPFIIAAALRVAQGSSTVAIVTTASIIAPLMAALGFVSPLEKTLVVMAICSGAMVLSHVNDSLFWVVTQLSGMSVKTGFKLQSLGTLVAGLAPMIAVWLVYTLAC